MVDVLNAVDKRYIHKSMSNVQLPGSNIFDSHMKMYTGNQRYDVSLAKEFQKHLTKEHRKNGVTDQGKHKKYLLKENGQIENIMFKIMLLLHTKM